jgi:hypothetical protein
MGVVRVSARLIASALVALLALPSFARAQEAEEARGLFVEANRAIDEGRFAEARDLLTRSLAMHPHVATAFNLGVALRGTGQLHRAAEVFEQILAGDLGELRAEQVTQVQHLLAAVRADFGTVELVACGDATELATIAVLVDGQRQTDVPPCAATTLSLDPGDHTIRLEADGFEPHDRAIIVGRGEQVAVEARLVARPTLTTEGSSEDPWIWLGVGALVLVAGAGVTTGVLLATQRAPHVVDPVFGEAIALRVALP